MAEFNVSKEIKKLDKNYAKVKREIGDAWDHKNETAEQIKEEVHKGLEQFNETFNPNSWNTTKTQDKIET